MLDKTVKQSLPKQAHVPFALNSTNVEEDHLAKHAELEEALLAVMRRFSPAWTRLDGKAVRIATNRAFIVFLMERTNGNQARAAQAAGFNRMTIKNILKRLRIDPRLFRPTHMTAIKQANHKLSKDRPHPGPFLCLHHSAPATDVGEKGMRGCGRPCELNANHHQ